MEKILDLRNRPKAFGAVRILFGLVCLINIYLQLNPAYSTHFISTFSADWVAGQPAWLSAYGHWMAEWVQWLGATHIATVAIIINAILAIALISGIGFPFLGWVGVIYNLWLWSTVGGLGGPYTEGATDPGTAIVYALCFLMVIYTHSWEGLSITRVRPQAISPIAMRTMCILFGLLWAFDSFWKWHPYFLTHVLLYLEQAEPGQPAWIVTYIGLFVSMINFVGPVVFGVFAALIESMIALTLLSNRALRWFIPIGIAYSIGIWTTAEGWGGPYGPGTTANKGDVLGTTNIYVIAFLFLAVWVYWTPHKNKKGND